MHKCDDQADLFGPIPHICPSYTQRLSYTRPQLFRFKTKKLFISKMSVWFKPGMHNMWPAEALNLARQHLLRLNIICFAVYKSKYFEVFSTITSVINTSVAYFGPQECNFFFLALVRFELCTTGLVQHKCGQVRIG